MSDEGQRAAPRGRHRHAADEDDHSAQTGVSSSGRAPTTGEPATRGRHTSTDDPPESAYPVAADIPSLWGSRLDESHFVPPWQAPEHSGRHSNTAVSGTAVSDVALDADGVSVAETSYVATVPSEAQPPVPEAAVSATDAKISPQTPKQRFGRNLPVAIGVGAVLAALVLGTLLIYRPSFLVVTVAAMGYACFELVRAMSHPRSVDQRSPLDALRQDSVSPTPVSSGAHSLLVPLLVGGVVMQLAAWERGPNGLAMALLITVAALLVWRLADGAAGYRRDVGESIFVLLYVPMLTCFAVLLTRPEDGAARVITFIATVVCSDTGGYAAGLLLGRRLMAPIVSKGKTWEGFAGSLVACAICGGLIMSLTFHEQWWKGVLFGLALAVTATLGDLGESLIKRDLGIKDMGSLLPGHGGLMDRMDSLLPCAAVAYLVLTAFTGT